VNQLLIQKGLDRQVSCIGTRATAGSSRASTGESVPGPRRASFEPDDGAMIRIIARWTIGTNRVRRLRNAAPRNSPAQYSRDSRHISPGNGEMVEM